MNIGTGTDQAIGALAELIAEDVGFKGRLVFDTSKPDGTPLKLLNVSRLAGLGWRAKTVLRDGLGRAYKGIQERSRDPVQPQTN